MAIPLKERTKINQLMARIESGAFDANDVDGILIKLRPYAGHRKVFREIADFVAHADARTKGVAQESMVAFADAMRFFIEYNQGKKQLDITQPFPAYVYRLFLSQSRQADEVHLKTTYKLSHSTLIKKIQSNFVLDKATKTCRIRLGKAGREFVEALQYVMGFIHSKPAFHLSDFHTELKEVLSDHGITFSEAALSEQLDRVALSILCLISGADVALPEGDQAKCRLECESHFRILQGQRRLPTGVISTEPNSFGTLQILGEITVLATGAPPLRVAYPLVASDLDPHDHCDPALFLSGNDPNEFGDYVVEVIDFAEDMSISGEFKLVRADSVCSES
jgi:hypothetical protein